MYRHCSFRGQNKFYMQNTKISRPQGIPKSEGKQKQKQPGVILSFSQPQ